ncbi:hypothetical protein PV326_008897 [Microctonus aethiopoides]|nr:hypothetical protein PV326_008897 [Microctonus aethiopoides]
MVDSMGWSPVVIAPVETLISPAVVPHLVLPVPLVLYYQSSTQHSQQLQHKNHQRHAKPPINDQQDLTPSAPPSPRKSRLNHELQQLEIYPSDGMDSLERLMSSGPYPSALTAASRTQNAFVQASLCSVIGRKGRHLTGTFCLTGDTMEGIIQCLVFLKAFSVRV